MAQLMLLNPRKRRARAKRRASPAQLRALAKGRASRRRRASPARSYVATNPRRRRRSPLRAATHHRTRRRVRRNPISSGIGIMAMVTNAGIGAAGALAVDAMVSYLVPASMATTLLTGNMKYLTKGALALGLGLVGRKLLGGTAARMAQGALTVQAYAMARDLIGPSMTGMTFSGLGYTAPAQSFVPRQLPAPAGMAQYVNSMNSGLNEYVPTSHY